MEGIYHEEKEKASGGSLSSLSLFLGRHYIVTGTRKNWSLEFWWGRWTNTNPMWSISSRSCAQCQAKSHQVWMSFSSNLLFTCNSESWTLLMVYIDRVWWSIHLQNLREVRTRPCQAGVEQDVQVPWVRQWDISAARNILLRYLTQEKIRLFFWEHFWEQRSSFNPGGKGFNPHELCFASLLLVDFFIWQCVCAERYFRNPWLDPTHTPFGTQWAAETLRILRCMYHKEQ